MRLNKSEPSFLDAEKQQPTSSLSAELLPLRKFLPQQGEMRVCVQGFRRHVPVRAGGGSGVLRGGRAVDAGSELSGGGNRLGQRLGRHPELRIPRLAPQTHGRELPETSLPGRRGEKQIVIK